MGRICLGIGAEQKAIHIADAQPSHGVVCCVE